MADRIYTVEEHGAKIQAFLSRIIERSGLELRFAVDPGHSPHPEIEDPELVIRFSGRDVDIVLANKAELLLALEYLTMEALKMPSNHHERVCFDANDYRMLRIAELRLSAAAAADKVKRSKLPFRFSPMSSRERRILHLALRNEPEVRSESAGVGPFRQVVIYPAGMPAPPEPPPRPFERRDYGGPPRRPGGGDRDRDRGGRNRRGPGDTGGGRGRR
ncbi:MAG TPA: R3H domain-containing nucleic acid-binding protein [Bryobacteraceae bacterium]|nr:R3H domain-containing nucleic acid-binding protein [Bryobacteraceae bacterium]